MSMLNLQASYFAIENPLRLLDRWLHGFRYRQTVVINRRNLKVSWTARAERELQLSEQPLFVELQLYFSCMVQKRVLFHRRVNFDTTVVSDGLEIAFRPITSAVCDPREFALQHPAGEELSSGVAAGMVPRSLELDFRRSVWEGCFHY
jgi:hypothetical protein